jgi:8-hydroxy-5-deazaflavin:NADPH oxidoreductase
MASVSIIGSGNMGRAISSVISKGGNDVQLLSHAEADATQPTGDIVVFAVYYPAIADVLAKHGAALAGKIVVDISNPLNLETFDSLVVPPDSSATAEIAAALPESRVLKAFNTTLAPTVASGTVGDLPTTVLIAGDDAEAKNALAEVITAGGLKAIDAGSLHRARELEALGFLQILLAAGEKISWTGGFAVVS